MVEPDFICYDKWPGPHSKVDTSTVLQGLQIHSSVPPGGNLIVNYLRDAFDRGLIVSPRDMLYDHKIT